MRLKILFDRCNIYIMLWALGHVQNFYFDSSLLSMIFYIPYVLMTIYYFYIAVSSFRLEGPMKTIACFFFLMILYGIGLLLLNNALGSERTSFLMMLLSSLGPIFPLYVFAKQGLLSEERMKGWLWIFLVIATADYFVTGRKTLEVALIRGSRYEEITNNSTYFFAALMPFAFLFRKRPIIQYLLLAYISFFVISGMKRGAIVVAALMILWFIYISFHTTQRGRKYLVILFSAVLLVVGIRYIERFAANSDYFQYRLESTMEGGSSGRDVIYSRIWNHYKSNDNVLQLAFGEGAFHSQNVTGDRKAHNDWLELLVDCGLFGVIVYFIYWVSFYKAWRKSKGYFLVYMMMGAGLLFTFARTFFSMSFSNMPFYINVILAFCFANWSRTTDDIIDKTL